MKKLIIDLFKFIEPIILILIIEISFEKMNGLILLHSFTIFWEVTFVYVLYLLFLGITKRGFYSSVILSILLYFILIVNQLKIAYTNEPLLISDALFLSKSSGFIDILSNSNVNIFEEYLPSFIIVFIILVIFNILVKKYEVKVENKKIRIAFSAFSIIFLFVTFFPLDFTRKIYLNLIFLNNQYKDYNSYTTNLQYYKHYGMIPGMWGNMLNNIFAEPDDYLPNECNEILEKYNKDKQNISVINKPNIIIVFSESFWDISKLEGIKFNKEITGNFNYLKQNGKYVELLSPTYGGMSENVAFEMLTGAKNCYFNKGYIPMTQLYSLEGCENMPSIVKELKNNGYISKINFGEDYYNCEEPLKKIGFDEYDEQSDFVDENDLVSDKFLTDIIIKEFENKEKNKPMLYMVETFENHMPYYQDKYNEYNVQIIDSNLTASQTETLTAYAQGIYNSDIQLRRLYEYILNYDEETMIIFLGDHLPYLYTKDGENLIDQLEYFNTDSVVENQFRKYNTEAIIAANFDLQNLQIPRYLSSELLLTSIINQMDIKLSSYYKWLNNTSLILPASNSYLSIDDSGKKYLLDEMNEEMNSMYNLKEKMQYHMFISEIK